MNGWVNKRFFCFLFFVLAGAASGQAAELPSDIRETIQRAVFEVVVPKPKNDPFTYEKKLPMELIPYHVRQDKYYSVGTAFAVGSNKLVTAAHVMNFSPTLWQGLFIRDSKGKVYAVDKIEKYSSRRDFCVFSVKSSPIKTFLSIETDVKGSTKVFSVGNAYGQGIVIRDGQHTSDTLEEVSGEWKWLRFSAAASPGNSGGPLLNEVGKVIGIVVRKSENENLNYALPMKEVISAPKVARVYHEARYIVDNMSATTMGKLDKKIKLPKSYHTLYKEISRLKESMATILYKKLIAENKSHIFPNGKGSDALLHSTVDSVFPSIITEKEDRSWWPYAASNISTTDLEDNGFVRIGKMGDSYYLKVRKPNRVKLKDFFTDSKLFMDLLLQGVSFTRSIGSEKVRVTSFGKANKAYTYVDGYSRRWMVRIWDLDYADEKIVCFCLPVPDGYVAILREGGTFNFNSHIIDLNALANFTNVSYYGTFSEWEEFLALKHILPKQLQRINFSFQRNNTYHFSTPRFSLTNEAKPLMDITPDSDMQIALGYSKERGEVVWGINKVVFGENKSTPTAFVIERYTHPLERMKESFHNNWKELVGQKWPYKKQAYFDSGKTNIAMIHQAASLSAETQNIYTVYYVEEGKVDEKDMLSKLMYIDKGLEVAEE